MFSISIQLKSLRFMFSLCFNNIKLILSTVNPVYPQLTNNTLLYPKIEKCSLLFRQEKGGLETDNSKLLKRIHNILIMTHTTPIRTA